MKENKTLLKSRFIKTSVIIFIISIVFVSLKVRSELNESYQPSKGFVPDDRTAIKVAEAIWLPIYGKDISKKKPFVATLKKDSVWVVKGTIKKNHLGGVPIIEIQKSDCKVLRVYHTQ